MTSPQFDQFCHQWFKAQSWSSQLKEVTGYMLFPGGKRLRAGILLSFLKDAGIDESYAFKESLAVELFHTASLIHDDLPCLDNDDERRGRASCHKQYHEAQALLCGDLLIGKAFSLLASSLQPDKNKLQIIYHFAQSWSELCEGQELDRYPAETAQKLTSIHDLKTGALFEATFLTAGLILEHPDIETFRLLGKQFGRIFQFCDDIADLDKDGGALPKSLLYSLLTSEINNFKKTLGSTIDYPTTFLNLVSPYLSNCYEFSS